MSIITTSVSCPVLRVDRKLVQKFKQRGFASAVLAEAMLLMMMK